MFEKPQEGRKESRQSVCQTGDNQGDPGSNSPITDRQDGKSSSNSETEDDFIVRMSVKKNGKHKGICWACLQVMQAYQAGVAALRLSLKDVTVERAESLVDQIQEVRASC